MSAMEFLIEQLSESVSSAKTLEDLARPMLEMLEAATGLESAYLAIIEPDKARQQILFAHNTGCLLYTSPSPRDGLLSRMPSSA